MSLSPSKRKGQSRVLPGSVSTEVTASPLKRRKIDENLYSENPISQLTLAEENLAGELLACNESIAPQNFPVVFPAPATKTLPLYSPETIKFLITTANSYSSNPFYLENKHSDITPKMIIILMDWMMEVCCDFHQQRETFHLAVSYVHSYLSLTDNLPAARLQLLGLSAIAVSAKLIEVHIPRLVELGNCAADSYKVNEIEAMELDIMKVLTWHLTPPTTFFWTNLYATQWDEFSKDSEFAELKFKEPSDDSYRRYRQLMQIVDSFSMEVEHLQYNQRILAGSAIYIVLSTWQYSIEYILQIYTKGSKFIAESNSFNKVFECFAKNILELSLEEMLPGVQYVATFVDMPLECGDSVKWEEVVRSYEELLNTQTYNRDQVDYLRAKHTNS